MSVVVSVDQSTQGTKGLVWSLKGELLGRCDVAHEQMISGEGWVSHDLEEIRRNVRAAISGALDRAGVSPDEVRALGISNQRETACCWRRSTGEPLCRAIVWQCGRAASICQELVEAGLDERSRQITGLPLSPFFSAPKFSWMLRNEPAVREAAGKRDLCFGTVDSYLIWQMTGGASFRTDCSNASRTGLMDLDTLAWSDVMLNAYGLERWMLPDIVMSDTHFGSTTLDGLFPAPVPIHGVLGDSHAALFAHGCHEPYAAKVTYGTGSSIMMNAGETRPKPGRGVVTSMAWGMNGKGVYCLEGNINYTGALVTWLVKDVELLSSPADSERVALSVPDNGGVYLVPAFSGLGAPYFENDARAAIVGMSRSCGRAHIVRAALETIGYQIADVVEAMEVAAAHPLARMCADGGPTRNGFLMKFQAGLLGRALEISGIEELSGAGAAYCAAIAAGLTDWETLRQSRTVRYAQPDMTAAERTALKRGWHNAVEGVIEMSRRA